MQEPNRGGKSESTSGPQGDRMAVLKQAYKNQFQTSFVRGYFNLELEMDFFI